MRPNPPGASRGASAAGSAVNGTAAEQGAHGEYRSRRLARASELARLEALERRIGNLRVVCVLFGLVVLIAAWRVDNFSPWWVVLPIVLFVALVAAHDRVNSAALRARRAVSFYDDGLARLENRWRGRGSDGLRFLDPAHLYASDLDILGPGSLYERLCTARTRAGEKTLADWLLAPADFQVVASRNGAVAELSPMLDLREEFALLGEDLEAGADPVQLAEWSTAKNLEPSRRLRLAALALATANYVTLGAWWLLDASPVYLLLSASLSIAFSGLLGREVKPIIEGLEHLRSDFELLSGALERMETLETDCAHLVALRDELTKCQPPASRAIRRLHLLADLLMARTSPLFWPIAAMLLWGTQLSFAVEGWRRRYGHAVARWLEVLGEFEALSSLAAYAFENPDHVFPELVREGPLYQAIGLGHPLIPTDRCVLNDVALGVETRALVVTGSNMSGKSTLLRSVGTSVVLALAGAPVYAQRLRLTPLAVGASIAIRDSLQDDTSHFYAELVRLKGIVELTSGDIPALFLIDEILQGTNSRDRHTGTTSVLRRLIDAGAIGLATTHDLRLGELAETLAPLVANVHFRDDLVDGRMHFDYQLRRGVVERSNALQLMQQLGLLD